MSMEVRILLDGENAVRIVPMGAVDSAFIAGVQGARHDKDRGVWVARLDSAIPIAVKLRDLRFHVEIGEQASAALRGKLASKREEKTAAEQRVEDIDAKLRANGKALRPYQRDGVRFLASRDRALLCDEMRLGKAQPLDEPVLTPDGFKPMGSLRVGDHVIGGDGRPTTVMAIHDRGVMDVYKVTMSDGSWTRCSIDHLWLVNTPLRKSRGAPGRVIPLSDIAARLVDGAGNRQHFIPMVEAVEYGRCKTWGSIIDPYLLGYIIGNGGLTAHSPMVTIPDEETRALVESLLPEGTSLLLDEAITYRISGGEAAKGVLDGNEVTAELRRLGLWGKRSNCKRIPRELMRSFAIDRIALLQGLLDSDGYCSERGNTIEFSTTSDALCEDFVELVESIGGVARPREIIARFKDYTCSAWRVTVTWPAIEAKPFRLSRKANRYQPTGKYEPTRAIVDVVMDGREPVRCISVASPLHLYVTRSFIVTHNTVQVLAAIPARPRLMIVCPKSVRSVWETESLFWRNDIFPIMHNGREPLRWPNPGEMIVCSYEQMDEEMPPAPAEVTFVGDEAHVFKKKNSLRSKRFRSMSRRVIDRGGKVIGLTATPLMDHATDLYNVLEAFELETEVFGNFARFYRLFNARKSERGFTQWGEADPKVHELMKRVMLRRRRAEVFPDLPPKSFVTIECKLPDKLKRASNQVVMAMGGFDWLKSDILDGDVDTTGTGHTGLRKDIATAKIDTMMGVVDEYAEAREPLVVFSAHTEPIRALAKRKDYGILLGETSDAERRRAIEDFQAGKLAGIGLSIRAGGVGIKLTRADNVLFVDREWTPALNWQAQDRVVDVDDKEKRITVMSIVGDHPLDARVEEIVRIKETLFNAAIDGRTE